MQSPQTMEAVDAIATGVHKHQCNAYLDKETHRRGEVHDVVNGAYIEHHRHGKNDGEEAAAVEEELADAQRHQDAEHNSHTAQHGNRNTLQLAGIGVVDDVLRQSDMKHPGIYPDGCQHGYQKGDNDMKDERHSLLLGVMGLSIINKGVPGIIGGEMIAIGGYTHELNDGVVQSRIGGSRII